MRYRERLNIVFMRDKGPRRSISMRRSRFHLLMLFFLSLPFACLLLGAECWHLWQANRALRISQEKLELDYQQAEQRAERLQNLEALLQEENVSSRDVLARQLALASTTNHAHNMEDLQPDISEDGPGHEEFPVVDTGRVKIENVQVRALRGNSIRVGLDLRNPENESSLSGIVDATLITADGEKRLLSFAPTGVGSFRINKYKRAVMTAAIPHNLNLVNASVIVEVREQDGGMLYQNMFAVQR